MKTLEWKTQTGQTVKVTVKADCELDDNGREKTSGPKMTTVHAEFAGEPHFSPMGYQRFGKPVGQVVAKIGQIGLLAETAAKIEKAIAEVNAEVAEYNALLEQHERNLDSLGDGDINTLLMKHGNVVGCDALDVN